MYSLLDFLWRVASSKLKRNNKVNPRAPDSRFIYTITTISQKYHQLSTTITSPSDKINPLWGFSLILKPSSHRTFHKSIVILISHTIQSCLFVHLSPLFISPTHLTMICLPHLSILLHSNWYLLLLPHVALHTLLYIPYRILINVLLDVRDI